MPKFAIFVKKKKKFEDKHAKDKKCCKIRDYVMIQDNIEVHT